MPPGLEGPKLERFAITEKIIEYKMIETPPRTIVAANATLSGTVRIVIKKTAAL